MGDPKSRARVERILRGELRADDITNLFLFARDHCDGRESVREIGHFVAHHNERFKGLVTETARDWYAIVVFNAGPIFGVGPEFDWLKLPDITPDFLNATFRRIDQATLKKVAHLSRKQAHKLLPGTIEKLQKNPDRTYAVTTAHTAEELALLRCLCGRLISAAAFSGERLFDDFVATLKSNGLVSKEEIRSAPHLRSAVLLFAIATMHNCEISINDRTTMRLRASRAGRGLAVSGGVKLPNSATVASTFFTTDLDPAIAMDGSLAELTKWDDIHMELAPSGKLTRLG